MSRLIGLGGALRAGKDAVGDHLVDKHGFQKLGMSDALNEALLVLNPWIISPHYARPLRYQELHNLVGYVEAKKNPEVRRLLQVLGTEVGREMISEDVWADIAERKISRLLGSGQSVVITAMRFPNEIEMLDRLGGFSVWVERDAVSRFAGLESSSGVSTPEKGISDAGEAPVKSESMITAHASENSVDKGMFEYFLSNNGSLEELYSKTDALLDDFTHDEKSRSKMRQAQDINYNITSAGGEPYVRYEYGGK